MYKLHILFFLLLLLSVGCANMKFDKNGKLSAIETSGDALVTVEICDKITETKDSAGETTGAVKERCQTIHSEGGNASEGMLGAVLEGLGFFGSMVSLGLRL